jgi:hypothetical protein
MTLLCSQKVIQHHSQVDRLLLRATRFLPQGKRCLPGSRNTGPARYAPWGADVALQTERVAHLWRMMGNQTARLRRG